MNKNSERIKNLVLLAILAALIVGLQFIGGINVGPFSITLTLIPIVVGAIILGPALGTVLGLVFGLIVSIFSLTGRDPGGQMVFAASPVLAWLLCLLKGAAAGFLVDYLPKDLQVPPAEPIVTSGLGGWMPDGLPVGVALAENGSSNALQIIDAVYGRLRCVPTKPLGGCHFVVVMVPRYGLEGE